MDYNSDYLSDILDEIALEGLDGITLQGLWLRLSQRPRFIFKLIDDVEQRFIWKAISRMPNIEFYELPSKRDDLIIFDRTSFTDSTGNFYEPDDLPINLYGHAPVEDNGIVGSCSTYNERKNVSDVVRNEDFDTVKRRGNSLVFVADQTTRSRALCSFDFNPITDLGIIPYCVLERIGRSRYEGETTQGKRGLQVVTEDLKMLYYFRKLLVKHKLVVKQVFFMRVGKLTSTGSLLHLPRFYKEFKTRQDMDALKLISHLETTPLKCIPLKSIKSQLNIELKKLLQKYPKNFVAAQVPYRQIHPSSKPSEWKLKASGEEKSIRVIKLLSSKIKGKDDEEDEDDEEEIGLMDESQRRLDRTLMRQAYVVVEKAGPRGIKQTALGSLLAVPSLQARSICKHLVKRQLVHTSLLDVGRQRITYYYSCKFQSSASSLKNEIQEEKNKFLEAVSLNSTICDVAPADEHSNFQEFCNEHGDSAAVPVQDISVKKNIKQETKSEDQDVASASSNNLDSNETISNPPATNATVTNEAITTTSSNENIHAEIIISKAPEHVGENSDNEDSRYFQKKSSTVTARMLKRAGIILQSVNLHKVIQDTQKVQRIISEVEESEGLNQTVDRKTVQRLLDKLESDGLLKTIRVNLKGYGREKSMLFICHPSVNESHSEIQSAIEQAKMKLPIVSAHHTKKNFKKNQEPKKTNKQCPFKHEIRAGRKYGYKPKCVRMRELHSFMFYLIYGYDGDSTLDQSCKEEIIKKVDADKSLLDEMSTVYRTEVDWKMFVPPLPVHAGYSSGWCLFSDVLLRLPVCIFVRIVNVPYNIPGLMEYINHPIKRNFLVKHLPSEILNLLTLMRKYIFAVSDIVARLGFIGLIQMGPQKLKEKDQVFIYLNRNALLYNTTSSDLGYNHVSKDKTYECIKYHFVTAEDVEQYWYDLWNFALHTSLGSRNSMTGKPVVVESVTTKKELLAAIQPKTAEEAIACDVGYIPGDNLGAAGLDSDMFVHLKRNWYWTNEKIGTSNEKSIIYPPVIKRPSKTISQRDLNSGKTPSPKTTNTKSKGENKAKEKDTAKHSSDSQVNKLNTKQSLPSGWRSRAVSKKKTRILRQRRSKYPRKPYYDQKDKDALSRMVKLRVDWSPAEDNLLLICKVASLYMSPSRRRHIAKNFCAVREILHSTYPAISRNKTSRACQRRMHYMMKNPFTAQSVYMCLEEIKHDPEIHAKFHRVVEKLDALLKAQREGPKGCQEEYDKIFINLVSTLLKKLKTIRNPENKVFDIKLPDTVAEFEKLYNPFIPVPITSKSGSFNEVQKNLDIQAAVVNAIIHSSLCCASEKTSYSNQLFYIYQQYPDKLLRYVMAKCRSSQIISCSKRYKRWKSMGYDCLPLASSPYQLSITYVHMLQSKYQYPIFSDCFFALKQMLEGPQVQLPSENENTLNIKKELDVKVTGKIEVSCGGQCANVVELFSLGLIEMAVEFPDQMIVLDPRLSEKEESYKLIMKRFKEMLSIIKNSRKKENKALLSDDEEDEEDINEECSQKITKEPHLEQFNLKNKTGVANTASRLALYLMRDEPFEQFDESVQHAHDYFVLNPCKVSAQVFKTKAEEIIFFKEEKKNILADIKRFATFPGEIKDNEEILEFINFEEGQNELLLPLLNFLESKCELGATFDEIKEKFEDKEFADLLKILVDEQFILKTGLVVPRFVHNKYSKPWLVKSFYLYRLMRESIGAEKTNASYAISFLDKNRSSGKTKTSLNKNLKRELSQPISLTPRKKQKLDKCNPSNSSEKSDSISSCKIIDPGPSTSTQFLIGNKDDEADSLDIITSDTNFVDPGPSNSTQIALKNKKQIHSLGIIDDHSFARPPANKKLKTTEDDEDNNSLISQNKGNNTLISEEKSNPSTSEVKSNPLTSEDKSNSSTSEEKSNPSTSDEKNNPSTSQGKASPSHSEEKSSEKEHQSRFLMRTTNRRWIAVPNENLKKFNNFDPSEAKHIYVNVRPWIKIDGTLNRRVLDRLLGSVLGHCLTCPGVAVTKVLERFSPALQPAHTYELLEILERIKCIKLIELKKAWKCNLFSKRVPIAVEPSQGPGCTTNVIVETEPLAVSRLGYFIGEKNYSIDYLAQLSHSSREGLII